MTEDEAQARIVHEFPNFGITALKKIGEGSGNFAFEVNGEYIFRFRKEGNTENNDFLGEIKILEFLKNRLSLPVPAPVFKGRTVMGYPKLAGRSLLECRDEFTGYEKLPEVIGDFLTAVNSIPLEEVRKLGVSEDNESLEKWLADARESFEVANERIPEGLHDRIRKFLHTVPPTGTWQAVFAHNDLGIEHMLVEGNRVTGIIDWSDASLADPAYDIGRLNRDLGEEFMKKLLDHYRIDLDKESLSERSRFYAVCTALEDLSVSLSDGKNELYWMVSLEALERLL